MEKGSLLHHREKSLVTVGDRVPKVGVTTVSQAD